MRYRKLKEPRLTLDTVSFLRVTLLQLTDTVIELAGHLILDTGGRAKRRAITLSEVRLSGRASHLIMQQFVVHLYRIVARSRRVPGFELWHDAVYDCRTPRCIQTRLALHARGF